MKKYSSVPEMQQASSTWLAEGRKIALIPTSGAIHNGHLALIREARTKADIVVVSLFTNPLQFGASENFAGYPKAGPADEAACAEAGADAVFLPAQEEIYPKGYSSYVTEEAVAKPLCGVSRPTHFRGVATFTVKLLNIIRPHLLVLGQKDAQMIAMLRKLTTDLNFTVDFHVVPIVRDADGLACAIRNRDLTASMRVEASAINQALGRAREMSASGVRSVDRIIAEVTHIFRQQRRLRVIYITIVDPATMVPMREVVPGQSLLTIAAWLEEQRLTDNTTL